MASLRALGALGRGLSSHLGRRRVVWCGGRGSSSSSASGAGAGRSGAGALPAVTALDRADAYMLRKAHEAGFLSWFRNGMLATGVGVIAYMQSNVGREAAYGFFVLGGVCICYGSGSYVANLVLLRRMMMLSAPTALLGGLVVGSLAAFWVCALSLYIGRLEVEFIYDEECDDCQPKEDSGKSDK